MSNPLVGILLHQVEAHQGEIIAGIQKQGEALLKSIDVDDDGKGDAEQYAGYIAELVSHLTAAFGILTKMLNLGKLLYTKYGPKGAS